MEESNFRQAKRVAYRVELPPPGGGGGADEEPDPEGEAPDGAFSSALRQVCPPVRARRPPCRQGDASILNKFFYYYLAINGTYFCYYSSEHSSKNNLAIPLSSIPSFRYLKCPMWRRKGGERSDSPPGDGRRIQEGGWCPCLGGWLPSACRA